MTSKRRRARKREIQDTEPKKQRIESTSGTLTSPTPGPRVDQIAGTAAPVSARMLVMQDVDSLYEILDEILQHLDIKTLLFAQRVCRKWRQVIDTSKPLQQNLFLLPCEPTYFWVRDFHGEDTLSLKKDKTMTKELWDTVEVSNRISKTTVKMNPLLLDDAVDYLHSRDVHWPRLGHRFRHVHPQSSCLRMYLTQPPCKNMRISYRGRKISEFWYPIKSKHMCERRGAVEGPKGKDVVDLFAKGGINLSRPLLDHSKYIVYFGDGVRAEDWHEEQEYYGRNW